MTGIRVGYVRVSTPEQYPERQIDAMKADKFYVDTYTGKVLERPQLQIMLDFLREGDVLVVHSMDRLARNLDDLRKIVLGLLNKKVKVEFVTEGLSFENAPSSIGLLMLSLMGAFAEFERNMLNERRAAGIALAKKRGSFKGRKSKFTPEIYAEIEKMNRLGASKRTICEYLNLGRTTVYNYLRHKGIAPGKKGKKHEE